MKSARLAAIAVSLVWITACRRAEGPLADAAPPPAASTATPLAEVAPGVDAGASTASLVSDGGTPPAGPATRGMASPEERRQVVAALFSGGYDAQALPEAATDPGRSFDRGLRKRLTTVEIPADTVRTDVVIEGSVASVPIANVDRVVAGMRARFRICYEQGLRDEPRMRGRLVLSAAVDKSGEVRDVSVTTNTGLTPVTASCVSNVLRRALFDAPASPSTIRVSLSFALPEK